jgi:EPS-associated MarR family transcriptional regulator
MGGSLLASLAQLPNLSIETRSMTSRQNQLQHDTYFRVMRLLQENPDLSQRELAHRLGVSVGGLNYCLKALIEKGWVKVHNFRQSKEKLGYAYILTPQGLIEKARLTGSFLSRKMQEFEALRSEIEALKGEADLNDQLASPSTSNPQPW